MHILGTFLGLRWLPEKLQQRRFYVRRPGEKRFRVHAMEGTFSSARSHDPRYQRCFLRWILLHLFPKIKGANGRILLSQIVGMVSESFEKRFTKKLVVLLIFAEQLSMLSNKSSSFRFQSLTLEHQPDDFIQVYEFR